MSPGQEGLNTRSLEIATEARARIESHERADAERYAVLRDDMKTGFTHLMDAIKEMGDVLHKRVSTLNTKVDGLAAAAQTRAEVSSQREAATAAAAQARDEKRWTGAARLAIGALAAIIVGLCTFILWREDHQGGGKADGVRIIAPSAAAIPDGRD